MIYDVMEYCCSGWGCWLGGLRLPRRRVPAKLQRRRMGVSPETGSCGFNVLHWLLSPQVPWVPFPFFTQQGFREAR